ncbi:MAG TPA: sodium/solute symporter [Candidatus Hydrogenedentes bacterium]|nr:sodium/solute symporter [Candidatus Hydrogenedentota bacterium]
MGARARFLAVCLAAVCLSATAAAATLRWEELPPLPDPAGVAGPVVGVHGDALIVAGGANFPEPRWETQKVFHDRVHVLLRETAGGKTAYRWVEGPPLARPLAYGACASTPRGVVCAGGNDAESVHADAFLLTWDAAKKTVVTTPLPPLPEPRTNAAAAVLGDTVYIAGGTTGLGLETADTAFLRLDLSRPGADWEVLPPWPGPSRALAIAAAQNNGVDDCVYLCSGRRVNDAGETEFLRDLYEFNPARHRAGGEAWRRRADAPRCLMAGTAAPVGQSHLFVLSGADEALFFQADTLKEAHPGFPKEAFAYHTITDTWVSAGETPANQVTTTAVRWGSDPAKDPVIVASGELRPRLRTPRVWAVTPVPGGARFGAADFTVLFLYLAAMLGVGVFFSFRNRTADDFFRGGRRVPWFVAGLSIFATMLSSITFMAIPAKSYATDWVYFLVNMTIVAVAPFVVWLFLPFFRKVDAASAYEYLERRFNRFARLFASASFTLFQIGRMAVVLYLPSLALAAITPLSVEQSILLMGVLSIVYCALGGLEAVVWTDTVQSFVLLGGALFSLVLILWRVDGGLGGALETALAHDKLRLATPDFSAGSFATSALWVVVLGGLAQSLVPYTSDMAVVQRYMAVPDIGRAKKAIWTNAVAVVPASLLFFGIGTALFVFYANHPDRLDPTFRTDAIFPLFIARELPVGVAGLVVAGVFAAAQSTISTSMNSVSTAVVSDFFHPWGLARSERAGLWLGRLFTVLSGVLGTGLALTFASSGVMSVWDRFMGILGLFGGSMCGLFCLGILTTRANGPGAVIGALAGAAGLYWVQRHTSTHLLLYAFIGVALCFVTGYVASFAFPPAKKSIRGLTIYTLRDADGTEGTPSEKPAP